jgi:hypothetical protein
MTTPQEREDGLDSGLPDYGADIGGDGLPPVPIAPQGEIAGLVERLRDKVVYLENDGVMLEPELLAEAASALEQLRAERETASELVAPTPQGEIGMDIAERLRDSAVCSDEQTFTLLHDAADRIEHAKEAQTLLMPSPPAKWKWPEPPFATPRDALANFYRSWGKDMAYREAEKVIEHLLWHGFYFCQAGTFRNDKT